MYCRTNPVHPRANSKGLYPLHRVLMENKIHRSLLPSEHVHHIDEDKSNNNIENLELLTASEHSKRHSEVMDLLPFVCNCCGSSFSMKPYEYRLRVGRNKSGKVFCSRKCSTTETYSAYGRDKINSEKFGSFEK